ncbi:hypothetical protein IAT40_000829 [Kwoniella sp. CBS 6097]
MVASTAVIVEEYPASEQAWTKPDVQAQRRLESPPIASATAIATHTKKKNGNNRAPRSDEPPPYEQIDKYTHRALIAHTFPPAPPPGQSSTLMAGTHLEGVLLPSVRVAKPGGPAATRISPASDARLF